MNSKGIVGGNRRPVNVFYLLTLAAILGLSFFVRLAMVDMVEGTIPIRNDAKEYYYYAANLKVSGVYSSMRPTVFSGSEDVVTPDAKRPPGYAFFLYPFVEVPPTLEMVYSIRVAQVILSTLTVLLAFLVCREFVSNNWALAGTLLVGISPHLVSMNVYLLTESLFTFILMLFVYLATQALAKSDRVMGFVSGVVLGLTLLVKASILYLLLLLIVVLAYKYRSARGYKALVPLCVGFLLVQAPWMVRNAAVELPESTKSKALVSLQNGSYPGLMYNDDPRTKGIPHRADPSYDDIESYSDLIKDVAAKIAREPEKYITWYVFGKAQMMLSWDMVAGAGDVFVYAVKYSPYEDRQPFVLTHDVMKALHPALMVLGLLGGVLGLVKTGNGRQGDEVGMSGVLTCGVVVLYYFLLHIVVTPLPRYMIPLRPLFYGLAVYFLSSCVCWIYSRCSTSQKKQ